MNTQEPFSRAATQSPLETLLAAAMGAPSGDNTQPWRFLVDSAGDRVEFHLDAARDPSPMNAGQRMARLAAGAALENLVRAAENLGWDIELDTPKTPALAAVRIVRSTAGRGKLDPKLAARVTNRRVYSGRPLAAGLVGALEQDVPERDGVRALWVTARERLDACAALIGRSDAMMFGDPSMRKAFLDKVRFDAADHATVDVGLPLASLELSGADRFALKLMPRMPNWLLKVGGAGRKFEATARKLIASASGICVIVAPRATPQYEVLVGRAMQRAWLALTARGLAVQPMMSLMVLENALQNGSAELVSALGREKLVDVGREMGKLLPEVGEAWAGFVLRFGYADPPSGRTGRLPLAASLGRMEAT